MDDFRIVVDAGSTIPKLLSHIDKYSVTYIFDCDRSILKLIGSSWNKSRVTCLTLPIKSYTPKDLAEISFCSELLPITGDFIISKKDNEIYLNDKNRSQPYTESVFTDWTGGGIELYDMGFKINPKSVANILKTNNQTDYTSIKYSKGGLSISNTPVTCSMVRSRNPSQDIIIKIITEDLLEIVDTCDDSITIYIHPDLPLGIRYKVGGGVITHMII